MISNHLYRSAVRLIRTGLLLAASLTAAGPSWAGQSTLLRVSAHQYGSTQHVGLDLNKSMMVELPADAVEVIVSQPSVATATMRTKRSAFIQGMGAGETNIFFLDASGNAIAVIDISVVYDGTSLASVLRKALPGSRISVESFGERVVLTGTAESADDVARAAQIATQFTGDLANVANLVEASGGQQVMLKVTVAEVSREVAKQLGINLSASYTNGSGLTTSIFGPNAPSVAGGASVGFSAGGFTLEAALAALNDRGASRTLAEPTLTALSGQPAEFLAGGEFPVPVGYEDGKTTYEFKEFGVRLNFTPTVKSQGMISLAVDTSVSELSNENSFTQGPVTIYGTRERQAKTSVELASGSTLAIAGLIEEKVRQRIASTPILGDIPIVGALFRSREFKRSETELVILVTPYIAQSTRQPVALPTDTYVPASDAEAIFLGRMETLYGVSAPDGELRGGFKGSVGFVLD